MDWRSTLAQHAAERSAMATHREMARGLYGLATVASVAPFMGMLGVLQGIFDSFRYGSGEKTALMALYFGGLSDAMIPAALGLAVAITASWGYQHLTAQLAAFDCEMHAAT